MMAFLLTLAFLVYCKIKHNPITGSPSPSYDIFLRALRSTNAQAPVATGRVSIPPRRQRPCRALSTSVGNHWAYQWHRSGFQPAHIMKIPMQGCIDTYSHALLFRRTPTLSTLRTSRCNMRLPPSRRYCALVTIVPMSPHTHHSCSDVPPMYQRYMFDRVDTIHTNTPLTMS